MVNSDGLVVFMIGVFSEDALIAKNVLMENILVYYSQEKVS